MQQQHIHPRIFLSFQSTMDTEHNYMHHQQHDGIMQHSVMTSMVPMTSHPVMSSPSGIAVGMTQREVMNWNDLRSQGTIQTPTNNNTYVNQVTLTAYN